MKQVWVNWLTCSVTRSTTRSALLPTVVTAMPELKSMSEFPSTSTMTPPPAAVDEDRKHVREAPGDAPLPTFQQLTRLRAGNLRDQPAMLAEGRTAMDC